MAIEWNRDKDVTFTLKSIFYRVVRVSLPVLSFSSILSGYYLIWSISPQSHLTEVIAKTRSGIALTLTGGVTLVVWMHKSFK